MASFDQNKGAPASDATNANFSRIVRGWGEASQRLYLWSYDANCACMHLATSPGELL